MHGLLASSEVYEFGQLGTALSSFMQYAVPKADHFFYITNDIPETRYRVTAIVVSPIFP